jgi:hypothetical protein
MNFDLEREMEIDMAVQYPAYQEQLRKQGVQESNDFGYCSYKSYTFLHLRACSFSSELIFI